MRKATTDNTIGTIKYDVPVNYTYQTPTKLPLKSFLKEMHQIIDFKGTLGGAKKLTNLLFKIFITK